jgi:hypothetical protein
MSSSIATQVVKVNGIPHPARSGAVNRVASLVRSEVHLELLSTVLQHLGHEWLPIQPAVRVQRSQDFRFASDFHAFAGT